MEEKGHFEDLFLIPATKVLNSCNTRYNHNAASSGLSVPTSYASRIVNVSAVNADARIEALGKAA